MKFSGALVLILFSAAGVYAADFKCPAVIEKGTQESAADCPWAGMARLMNDASSDNQIISVLEKYEPRLLENIKADAASKTITSLWGTSLNFDEGAKDIILRPQVYNALAKIFHVQKQDGKVVHAGTEHTYGYLFSNLDTPFGYKRARWVVPDIEKGFGLAAGDISPVPSSGTMLANATFFFGSIAFRDDAVALKKLADVNAAPDIKAFDYSKLPAGRVSETIKLGKRTVELRTDIVLFPHPQAGNQALLVYSVHDSAQPHTALISGFPIAAGFANGALNPAKAGEGKKIITRYNAFVKDVTGKTFTGTVRITPVAAVQSVAQPSAQPAQPAGAPAQPVAVSTATK
jgi:hypothetical protein